MVPRDRIHLYCPDSPDKLAAGRFGKYWFVRPDPKFLRTLGFVHKVGCVVIEARTCKLVFYGDLTHEDGLKRLKELGVDVMRVAPARAEDRKRAG